MTRPKMSLYESPSVCGLPLKYVSLVTLAVQNAALSIVMHYSRVSIPAAQAYSPATAVLLNELLKGSISFVIALARSPVLAPAATRSRPPVAYLPHAVVDLASEIFSPDCWKLSIPAILYVIQNSLQFVAISNLPVATFQVTYQMKILTTAAFSVALLRKKLSGTKWLSLFFLAIGVGIVQIQSTTTAGHSTPPRASTAVGSAQEFHVHVMNPLKGFGAVTAACFTSGLAGVYFEMVLKGSKADLWVRNVQLSLFSLIPALLPVLYSYSAPPLGSRGFILDLFRNFGFWAWATVAIQVLGGLITAIVIKYSDNILKGFATSLSIILSFLASVVLFDFTMTPSFIIGASTVLAATWMYNQPSPSPPSSPVYSAVPSSASSSVASSPILASKEKLAFILETSSCSSGKTSPYPTTPTEQPAILGSFIRRKSSGFGAGSNYASHSSSTASLSALLTGDKNLGALGLAESGESPTIENGRRSGDGLLDMPRLREGYASSPLSSRPASRIGSRAPSPTRR